jgi:hypothetical protein
VTAGTNNEGSNRKNSDARHSYLLNGGNEPDLMRFKSILDIGAGGKRKEFSQEIQKINEKGEVDGTEKCVIFKIKRAPTKMQSLDMMI